MEISAKDVMALRKASGMGMMECKKALEEAGGDFEKAFEILRKRGLKAAEKKADRATAEGLVGHAMSADGHTGTMLLVLCETEPVKNTAMFQDFVATATKLAAEKAPADLDALLALPWPGDDGDTVDAALKSLIGKIGENMRVSGYKRLAVSDGVVGAYVHHDKKTGAIVALEGKSSADLADFAKQLCMHIVFSKPTALDRDEIPEADVQRELEFLRQQAQEDESLKGKPEKAVEGIIQGRLSKNFFGSRVLTEQPWFSDNSKRVADHLKAHGVQVKGFAFFQPGA